MILFSRNMFFKTCDKIIALLFSSVYRKVGNSLHQYILVKDKNKCVFAGWRELPGIAQETQSSIKISLSTRSAVQCKDLKM